MRRFRAARRLVQARTSWRMNEMKLATKMARVSPRRMMICDHATMRLSVSGSGLGMAWADAGAATAVVVVL